MRIPTKILAASCALLAGCANAPMPALWKADLKCSAREGMKAFEQPLKVRLDRNVFYLSNDGGREQPGYVRLSGLYDPDDRLQLVGEVAPPGAPPEHVMLEGAARRARLLGIRPHRTPELQRRDPARIGPRRVIRLVTGSPRHAAAGKRSGS